MIMYQVQTRETNTTKGLFEICLFCWNWKFFAENIVFKGKS